MGSLEGIVVHFLIVAPVLRWLLNDKRPWKKELGTFIAIDTSSSHKNPFANLGIFLAAAVVLTIAVYQVR